MKTFFSNKHVITAMIVAPILAVLTYFLVDLVVADRPQPAEQGRSYPLVAKSNCRYTSGVCDLENSSFKTRLTVDTQHRESRLLLSSSHPLMGVKVAFVNPGDAETGVAPIPADMASTSEDARRWAMVLPPSTNQETQLLLALRAFDSDYYAETSMSFSEYKTIFDKNFQSN